MNEDFYIGLIYKELSEEISSSEAEQLDSWKNASEDNQSTYHAVIKAWEASDLLSPDVSDVDVSAEFAELEALMDEPASEKTTSNPFQAKQIFLRSRLRIAASLLLLITASFLIYNTLNKQQSDTIKMLTASAGTSAKTVELADGSTVYLNKNSQLIYPQKFNADTRNVQLKGEAFFEVEHNPQKPFSVNTDKETITVLGTSFNIQMKSENLTSVYVATGKVEVKQQKSQNKVILVKGEKVLSDIDDSTLTQSKANDNELAWHTRKLTFSGTSMQEIRQLLEKYYSVKIIIENLGLSSCTIDNYSFENEPIETVLEDLSTILSFETEKKGINEFIIKGGGCD